MKFLHIFLLLGISSALHHQALFAEVFRWDNQQLISGTTGVVPAVGADLSALSLSYGDFQELNLSNANFNRAVLSNASFRSAILENASLANANLSRADFLGASIGGADLSGTEIVGANFNRAAGFAEQQLYSTASYQSRDLNGVGFWLLDLNGWNFRGQDLTGASLAGATTQGTDFTDAIVLRTNFGDTSEFRSEQLYATASYKSDNLTGIGLWFKDLSNWNLAGKNLDDATFRFSSVNDTDFSNASIIGAEFGGVSGFVPEQLYSTASYKAQDLRGVALWVTDLKNWNFSGQDLTSASMGSAMLDGTDLTGAKLQNAFLAGISGQPSFDANSTYNQWTVFPDGFDPVSQSLTFVETQHGDFDANEVFDAADMSLLLDAIYQEAGSRREWLQPMFDLNSDEQLDQQDLRIWIKDAKRSWIGDSNLDGEFNTSDLVGVFQFGQYEDQIDANSRWESGDWNGDQEFTTSDLVVAFQDGGFEAGPRLSIASIPEPNSLLMIAASIGILLVHGRNSDRRPSSLM